jgi:TRAP-type C4-dicarboxylate transport system substrate-binding protein
MITRRTFTAGAATLLAARQISTRAQAATTHWDLSTVWPDGNFHTKNAMAFADEVKKQTGGTVDIIVKAGGQLGFKGAGAFARRARRSRAACRRPQHPAGRR